MKNECHGCTNKIDKKCPNGYCLEHCVGHGKVK